jgi:hypothetical protein
MAVPENVHVLPLMVAVPDPPLAGAIKITIRVNNETRQTKPQECLRLITESAELSFVFAQRWFGFSYSSGTDAPKDCQKARYWLDRAGQQGDVLSVARRSVMKMKDCSARLKNPVDRGRNEIEPGDSACGRYSSVVLADVFANLLVRP